MNVFRRSVQLYLLVLAFAGTLALVWGTNKFLLGRSTLGTGWPLIVGIAVVLVPLGVLARGRWSPGADASPDRYPWSGRDR